MLTPLPPVRSGISNYASMLLPSLARRVDLTAVVDQQKVEPLEGVSVLPLEEFRSRRSEFDRVVYQAGNNLHHQFIYREAVSRPAILVLHDMTLHHLIVEMTLARGRADEYFAILRENHGAAGEAYARGIAHGFHDELGKFLFPASIALANRSTHVLVHNRWALETLRSLGVRSPMSVVEHPLIIPPDAGPMREAMRIRLGLDPSHHVVGMFGFVTRAKRPEVVFEAFARAAARKPELRLLIVGQPSDNVDLETLAGNAGLARDQWHATGYVPDEEFDAWLATVDRVVNLRHPSAGETSGALLRVFAAGKPVAVSHSAQFADLPRALVTPVPFGEEEVEALASFFLSEDSRERAAAQREWIRDHADVERAADVYAEILAGNRTSDRENVFPVVPALPLALFLEVIGTTVVAKGRHWEVTFQVRNCGASMARTAAYGELEALVIAAIDTGAGTPIIRRLHLDRDLRPGEVGRLRLVFTPLLPRHTLGLSLAVDGIPTFESTPFYSGEIAA
ncbi:MAG TPA: glycosyltransferase [Thermoanaerobaculia bacterium]|nr:glycosyltransferase [Thermoanaerobaculia bacterium]